MADSNDGFPVDRTELWVRFGCGAALGAFLAWSGHDLDSPSLSVSMTLSAVVFGLLARQYGDRFWTWARWWD